MMNKNEEIEFVTTEEYTKEDIKKVQQKSLEMMKKIIEIFDRNHIEYMVAHGTLLGAIRHKAFIPWDDDCDLFVFDHQYAQAIELLRREIPGDMLVHNKRTDPIYWCKWSKIRDLKSDAVESLWKIDNKMKYHGVCIDILKVTSLTRGQYKVRKDKELVKKSIRREKKRFRKSKGKSFFVRVKALGRKLLFTTYLRMKLVGLKMVELFHPKKMLYANLDTIIEASFAKKDVFPLKEYPFEDTLVKGPKNVDAVLRGLYGDYMALPPVEKRVPHYSSITFYE